MNQGEGFINPRRGLIHTNPCYYVLQSFDYILPCIPTYFLSPTTYYFLLPTYLLTYLLTHIFTRRLAYLPYLSSTTHYLLPTGCDLLHTIYDMLLTPAYTLTRPPS